MVLERAVEALRSVIRGKERVVRLCLACLLARGHLLLEDLPGMGKTTLAVALARVTGCSFVRIQFTSDLLPSDVIGTSVYHPGRGEFAFRAGPIFHQVVLADEINRATPRTQSALLEAMGEGQVSVEGRTLPLPRPFFVLATQNPRELHGTFPLPESQLDRFLMRLELGYPPREAEREVLLHGRHREDALGLEPVVSPADVLRLQEEAEAVRLSPAIADYVLELVEETRRCGRFRYGLSPRGALALARAAKAWALMEGRRYVVPEDVKEVFVPVALHRLWPRSEAEGAGRLELVRSIPERVPVPR